MVEYSVEAILQREIERLAGVIDELRDELEEEKGCNSSFLSPWFSISNGIFLRFVDGDELYGGN